MFADLYTRDMVELEAKENRDKEDQRELCKTRGKLLERLDAIDELEAFYDEVRNQWADIGLRNIGHVRYAKAISVDVEGGTLYTEDYNITLFRNCHYSRESNRDLFFSEWW